MKNIENIYLDLDGTVYDQHNGLMEKMTERIVKYGREVVNLPQKVLAEYYREYGNTLRGLMLHQHVDPQEYLAYIHDLPLEEYLSPDPDLRRVLLSLPQPKWILTNSWRPHAERTLELLGIDDLFMDILDVQEMNYEAKPRGGGGGGGPPPPTHPPSSPIY
jgi:putative hydrolase of the HAD superfamily